MIPRGELLKRALMVAKVNVAADNWEASQSIRDLMAADVVITAGELRTEEGRERLMEALSTMERGTSLRLGDIGEVRRTAGQTGRFKLKVPGEKVRTVTGAKATARVIVSKLTEVGDG